MNKIQSISRFFVALFQVLMLALPVILAISWVHAPDTYVTLLGFIHFDSIPASYANIILHPLSVSEKAAGFLLSCIPLLVYLYILRSLILLFRLYAQGVIFSSEVVQQINHIGYALLIGQLINPFYQCAMGYILTINNPVGQRIMRITLDQTNIGILLVALMTILISWIMTEGCKLREEQQLTI